MGRGQGDGGEKGQVEGEMVVGWGEEGQEGGGKG